MIITVSAEHAGQRLDRFIADQWQKVDSRSEAQRLIKAQTVRVDDLVVTRASTRVGAGQVVRVDSEPAAGVTAIEPSDLKLSVIYEDEDLAVIDKPAGLTVHPGAGHVSDTLVNAAVSRWPRIVGVGEPDRPGVVHRIDRDTSGLLLVALSERAYSRLSEMIRDHKVRRTYTALVHGHPDRSEGVVDAPVGRDPYHRTRQAVVEDGRPSRTLYRTVRKYEDYALLELQLETGRTHQIRVHMDAIGHPVVGDQTYGTRHKKRAAKDSALGKLDRQFLHASKLEFNHPVSGKLQSMTSDLPDDLEQVLTELTASGRR